jgi:hypothetical protein
MTKYSGQFDLEQYACPFGETHKIETVIDDNDYPYGVCVKCCVPSRDLDQELRDAGVKARQYVKPKQSSRMKPPRKSRARQGPRIR